MNCTVDASVFVAAARAGEPLHAESAALLSQLHARKLPAVCPTLVLPECAAAIARRTGDSTLVAEMMDLIMSLSGLQLIALDLPLAERAAQLAATHRLRGADAVYVTVAEVFNSTLVTLDSEMLNRAPRVVSALSPDQWLTQQPRP